MMSELPSSVVTRDILNETLGKERAQKEELARAATEWANLIKGHIPGTMHGRPVDPNSEAVMANLGRDIRFRSTPIVGRPGERPMGYTYEMAVRDQDPRTRHDVWSKVVATVPGNHSPRPVQPSLSIFREEPLPPPRPGENRRSHTKPVPIHIDEFNRSVTAASERHLNTQPRIPAAGSSARTASALGRMR